MGKRLLRSVEVGIGIELCRILERRMMIMIMCMCCCGKSYCSPLSVPIYKAILEGEKEWDFREDVVAQGMR